ncbi:MAG: alcohol dehydrogenase catalytic domain-containing protein [Sulfolobales archaeon]
MKAAIITKPGSPDEAFEIKEISDPVPREGEALIKVLYCGINHIDLWQRRGSRLFAVQYPRIPGSEAVGIVEKINGRSDLVREGDYVVVAPGWGDGVCRRCLIGRENECDNYTLLGYTVPGCYAEKITVPLTSLRRIPEEYVKENYLAEISGIPLTYTTVYHGLVTKAGVEPGERVFVWSASGGTGIASINLGKIYGAEIYAHTRSPWKKDFLEKLGADKVIVGEYDKIDLSSLRGEMDIVIDYIGSRTFNLSLELLRRGGRLILFGVTSGHETTVNLRQIYSKRITIYGVYVGSRWEFNKIIDLYFKKLVKPHIHKIISLEKVSEAHKELEAGEVVGKIIIRHQSS